MSPVDPNPLHWDWWVDFVEGEQELYQRGPTRMLLQHSALHKLIVSNLSRLRKLIHACGRVELPTEDKYYSELHGKIMNQIIDKRVRGGTRAPR